MMTIETVDFSELKLDHFGRVILSDQLMKKIEQYDHLTAAAGSNAQCGSSANSSCTNGLCNESLNGSCTNQTCQGSANSFYCQGAVVKPPTNSGCA